MQYYWKSLRFGHSHDGIERGLIVTDMDIDDVRRELQELKDEKYHLLKLINHDIRSPFNRIFALLQLLELDIEGFTDLQGEYVNSMYLSILSGLEMIQNLRDMREIDAGFIEISNAPFQLDDLYSGALRSFSKQIDLKKISVKIHPAECAISLNSDSYYLQRIFENLFSNALKFSKEGSEVWISSQVIDGLVNINIRDFGEGIKQEEASGLFQKFKKLSSHATGGEGSLGLGLSNANALVKMLGGTIMHDHVIEPGSCFIISVPQNLSP